MDGVKRIGPTRYEVRKTDFLPQAELNILILKREGPMMDRDARRPAYALGE